MTNSVEIPPYAEKVIGDALASIIKANGGWLSPDAIPRYVAALVATRGFIDEAEIKAAFNRLSWRGLFNIQPEHDNG